MSDMRRWLERCGYGLCFTLAFWRVCKHWPVSWVEHAWTWVWYRYYCPYPVVDEWTARACVRSGNCGCNNLDRYAGETGKEATDEHADL